MYVTKTYQWILKNTNMHFLLLATRNTDSMGPPGFDFRPSFIYSAVPSWKVTIYANDPTGPTVINQGHKSSTLPSNAVSTMQHGQAEKSFPLQMIPPF